MMASNVWSKGRVDELLAQLPPAMLAYVAAQCSCVRPPFPRRLTLPTDALLQRDFVALLPKEIAGSILELLDPPTLGAARRVSRVWRDLVDTLPRWALLAERFTDALAPSAPRASPYQICRLISSNWRAGTYDELVITHHVRSVFCVDFDLHHVVSASYDGTLVLWRFDALQKSLTCQRILRGHTKVHWSLCLLCAV
jgi:hypothetical protein